MINLFIWAVICNTRLPPGDDESVEEVEPDETEVRDHSKAQKLSREYKCGSLPAYIKAEYDYLP